MLQSKSSAFNGTIFRPEHAKQELAEKTNFPGRLVTLTDLRSEMSMSRKKCPFSRSVTEVGARHVPPSNPKNRNRRKRARPRHERSTWAAGEISFA